MKSTKILIVSTSIGNGHMQAASAIYEQLKKNDSNSVEVVDFLQVGQFRYPKLNRLQIELMNLMKSSYYGMLKVAPNLYKELYKITENQQTRKVIDFINAANQNTMAGLIARYRPHIVVCTHPFPLGAAAALCRKKKLSYIVSGVITDFAVHPWWIANGVDHYFVANEVMEKTLMQHGISHDRITISGIPVGSDFKPTETRAMNQVPHILVMGGGLGFGRMQTTLCKLEQLPKPVKVTVVAGKNEELKKQLQFLAKSLSNDITVLPFSPHIAMLMKQADVLITKPGGLTCSEALAVHLPMILLNPLPGQEEENSSYLQQQGSALWIQEEKDLISTMNDVIFDKPEMVKRMQQKCAEISPQYAGITITKQLNIFAESSAKQMVSSYEYWKVGVR